MYRDRSSPEKSYLPLLLLGIFCNNTAITSCNSSGMGKWGILLIIIVASLTSNDIFFA